MADADWSLNPEQYLEAPGVCVLAFHNAYPDGRQAGIEIIHHGERVATCGMLRPSLVSGAHALARLNGEREADADGPALAVPVEFRDVGLSHTVRLRAEGDSVVLALELPEPLSSEVVRDAAFSMELYPPAYFGRSYQMDGRAGVFPRDASGPPLLARGRRLVIAAEAPERRLVIEGIDCDLELLDGRYGYEKAWYVVRTAVPLDAAGQVVRWRITPNRVPGWRREPVLCVSQVGYHPEQKKRVVIELDPRWDSPAEATLNRLDPDDGPVAVHSAVPEKWGRFLRYEYAVFDFTHVREPGLYTMEYAGQSAGPFRIHPHVYRDGVWQPTLEHFFPAQMCHVTVRNGGHVWHGACHLDDALQAPTDHRHFDGYAQGSATDTPYEPGEHIPGLDVGGWHDAGDADLAAGSQAQTVHSLALAWREFGVETDQTTVRPEERLVLIHEPDGVPDIVQQIAYGVECLLGGYRAVGHSFCGIIAGDRDRHHQQGAFSTMTDNLVYDPSLGDGERTGTHSGVNDDRWAFTNRDTALEYAVAAALACASTALQEHFPELAEECIQTAVRVWEFEQDNPPARHRSAYVPRDAEGMEVTAAAELLAVTGEERYRTRLRELLPVIREHAGRLGPMAARALPCMDDEDFAAALRQSLEDYAPQLRELLGSNPFGVRWQPHIWGEAWNIQDRAVGCYFLHRAFPDLFDREDVLSAVNYVLGCHPGSNTSLVSGVGVHSLTAAYGINCADWHYTPGGVVSGTALIRPDFPELKEGFPFLWQQSEYVMSGAASYIFCVLAADALLNREDA